MIEDLLSDSLEEFSEGATEELTLPTLDMTEGQIESLNLFGGFVNGLIFIMLGAMLLMVVYEIIMGNNFIIPFFG